MSDQTPDADSHDQRIAALREQIETAKAEVAEMTSPEAVSKEVVALNPGIVPAEVTRQQMAAVRGRALKKVHEIEALNKALKAELEAQANAAKAEMEALMGPLIAQMKQMEEGLWTVNLYLGRDEEIVPLLDGSPAPADTPFVLRQEVLSMDEETAAHAADGGIDAMRIEVFDEWIKDPAHLAQVLPEPKGVVALVPRRRGRDYQDPWINDKMDKANKWTYFLIRNGERLFRMSTDFVVGQHLIPATDEFTGLFVKNRYDVVTGEYVTEHLVPGTREWEQAEKAQDARQRHFMRMAMILQGLVDRTTVYHPLPPGGLDLLDNRTYDEGKAILVRDAEGLLTDGREDFYAWLNRLTHDLRPGMRILGAFDTDVFKNAGSEYMESSSNHYTYRANNRITPTASSSHRADKPQTGVLYRLEGRKTIGGVQGFYFKFDRTTRRWIGDDLRAPKTKGTCTILPGDRFVIPFDLVTVEDMKYYLGSRRQRHAYEEMFPLMHAAIEAKEAEVAEEAPFRTLLAGELVKADADLTTLDEGHAALGPLVDWWKFKNKYHRALVGDPEHESLAIREIVAEHLARKGVEAAQTPEAAAEQKIVDLLLAKDPTIMVIGRKRDGGYLAFAPQPRTYPAGKVGHPATNVDQPPPLTDAERTEQRDNFGRKPDAASNQIPAAVTDNVWAVEYTTGKTGRSIKAREWVQPGTRMDATRILHTTETWDGFDIHASGNDHLTDPEIDAAIGEFLPEIKAIAASGWPGRHRINNKTEDPFTPLILGVTLRMGPGVYVDHPSFEVHLIDAAEPKGLDEKPSAVAGNRIDMQYGEVVVYFTKTRDGVRLHRSNTEPGYRDMAPWGLKWTNKPGSSAATPDRPWHHYYGGVSRDQIALVEFPDNGKVALDRVARISEHNAAVDALRDEARKPMWHAKRAGDAALEAKEYARFIEDFHDPDLWEGHKKSLRDDAFEISFHPHGRDVPEVLRSALYRFIDEGWSLDGHTIATAIKAADLSTEGVDESLLDLPLWGEGPGGDPDDLIDFDDDLDDTDEEDDEDGETQRDEDDFDEHGLRTDEDGIVILSGADVIVGSVVEPIADEPGNLPAVVTEPADDPDDDPDDTDDTEEVDA